MGEGEMMDFKTAKRILQEKLPNGEGAVDGVFSRKELSSMMGWYLFVEAENIKATLDGKFTADELEAIAAWMRNPDACVDA